MYEGSGSYCAPAPDSASRHDGCAQTHQGAFPDLDLAAGVTARCDMGVIPDAVVVIDCAACVQDDILAHHRSGVQDNACADHAARADFDIGSDGRVRMPNCDETFSTGPEFFVNAAAGPVVPDRDDDCLMRNPGQLADGTEHTNAEEYLVLQMRGVVQIPSKFDRLACPAHALQCIRHDLSVSPCTNDHDAHTYDLLPMNSLAVACPS